MASGASSGDSPDLSAVITTPDCFETIRKTIRHLKAQAVRERIEVVIVAPESAITDIGMDELQDFWGYQVVRTAGVASVGAANAAGIRRARAPIVALAEDHSFPEPGWAEALLEAHRGPWAAVGPAIRNANPRTLVSWADLFVAYAPWLDPAPAGPRDHLPGHNSSYKRDVLLRYGDDLEQMMASESVMHWDLRRRGHQLYLEPKAKTAHTNFSLLSSWLVSKFFSGRVFASARVRDWPYWKRLVLGGASPLIPLVRLRQILGQLRKSRQPAGLVLRVLPVLLAGLALSAAGEMAGYLLGAGGARERLARFEFHRSRHLCAADQKELTKC